MFRLRDVSLHYGCSSAGIDIDELDIQPQGITVVIGPSGSGKTTLLSVLAGFIPANVAKGGFLLCGEQAIGLKQFEPGKIGFVFQSPMLLGAAGGSVNMLAGHAARPLRRRAPIAWRDLIRFVKELGLHDSDGYLLAKRARQLSGGEAQRIAVLRALLTDPEVILCDEPTSSLDENNARQVMTTLKDWAATSKRPVVWVTHNLEQAARYADHYVFLKDGGVYRPTPEDAEGLASDSSSVRLATLRRILTTFLPTDGNPATDQRAKKPQDGFQVSPLAFNRWIARALSTDSAAGAKVERENVLALAAPDHVARLSRVFPDYPGPGSWLARFWNLVKSYPRRSLTILLTVTIFQAIAAATVASISRTYYDTQLGDPALWRLTFSVDNLSQWNRSRGTTAPPLIVGTIDDLRDKLAKDLENARIEQKPHEGDLANKHQRELAKLGDDNLGITPGAAASSLNIVGRRFVHTSIRLPASATCSDWQLVASLVVGPADPILHLADFGDVPGGSRGEASRLSHQVREAARGNSRGLLVADRSLNDALKTNCGPFPAGTPVYLEWAPSEAEKDRPAQLQLADTIIRRMPPVHPYEPRIIVFEPAYADLAQQDAGSALGKRGFEQASVFLPNGDLARAEEFLKEKGYSVTDDSRAAIATLQQFSRIMEYVPVIFQVLNIIAVVVGIVVMVLFQLELNRRVFTLFLAMGFRVWDVVTFLFLHLLPSIVVALAACWVAIWLSRLSIIDTLPRELGLLRAEFFWATMRTTAIAVIAFALAILVPALFWWRMTARRLTENLKE